MPFLDGVHHVSKNGIVLIPGIDIIESAYLVKKEMVKLIGDNCTYVDEYDIPK